MGDQARAWDREDVAGRLQELVLESFDVGDFLGELAEYAGVFFSTPGIKVRCAFTVLRRKKSATVASSDSQARMLDEVQLAFGEGPCLAAMQEMTTVHVPDVASESCWPAYVSEVAGHGVGSILAVPLALEGETRAALNLFSPGRMGSAGKTSPARKNSQTRPPRAFGAPSALPS